MAPNPLEDLEVLQEVENEVKVTNKSKTRDEFEKTKRRKENSTLIRKNKELKKSVSKLTGADEKSLVFRFSIVGTLFNQVSVVDKLIMLVLERMKSKGQLAATQEKNTIILEEDKSKNYANCYKFINYIIQGLNYKNEVIRFKLDSTFIKVFEEVIQANKFSRYEFKILHHSISEEPSIIEVKIGVN